MGKRQEMTRASSGSSFKSFSLRTAICKAKKKLNYLKSHAAKKSKTIQTTPGARKAVTLLKSDKSVYERRVSLSSKKNTELFKTTFYLPEVFVDKGRLAGGQAVPAGLASGIGHQNRVNLKAGALETSGGGCEHLKRSNVLIKLLKDQYVTS